MYLNTEHTFTNLFVNITPHVSVRVDSIVHAKVLIQPSVYGDEEDTVRFTISHHHFSDVFIIPYSQLTYEIKRLMNI